VCGGGGEGEDNEMKTLYVIPCAIIVAAAAVDRDGDKTVAE